MSICLPRFSLSRVTMLSQDLYGEGVTTSLEEVVIIAKGGE
jgi:hypothetical protein